MPPILSVLMPVYNERETLPSLLERVLAVPLDMEIILVDDCSKDGTREWIQENIDGKRTNIKVLYHSENQGKGAALRTAIPYATGEYSIVQDGDLEYDPNDYLILIQTFKDTNSDIVYGSRFMKSFPKMRFANKCVNILLAWMVRVLYGQPMTDEATCYKAFRTPVLQAIPLTCKRFEFCPEVTAKALRRGHRVVEAPISYKARSFAEGKKIRWTDGVDAIWTLIKWRFMPFK